MKVKLNEMVEICENEELEAGADIEIFAWAVSEGDAVKKGDKMMEVMVGKTSIEVAVPADGIISVLVEEGEIVSGDDVIAEIN